MSDTQSAAPDGLQTITPGKTEGTYVIPERRIKDAASLGLVIDRIIQDDDASSKERVPVQEAVDGKAPFDQRYLDATGQEGRCNLNFGDMKKRVKLVSSGYYDLTESVPSLLLFETDYGKAEQNENRTEWNNKVSEEIHQMIKQWSLFDSYHQLLVQKFVTHGVGFLYFRDDDDWHWEVAGLEDFKVPRSVPLNEGSCEIAIVLRDVPVTKLWKWYKKAAANDTRWNRTEVADAIMKASGDEAVSGPEAWERWQEKMKNNDLFASITAKNTVKIVYAWVQEFSGKYSQFITLRDKSNKDYLFKCYERFASANECFTFFPFEVGTNGLLHSVRGEAHDIYAKVQVMTHLQCQGVDNAKITSSLILQPNSETAAEDMAVLFFGGAAYIPPNIEIKNASMANPATNMLPILESMSMGINGDVNTNSPKASQQEKTKFEVKDIIARESILPTAAMALFYQPWGRHLTEVCRRMFKPGKSGELAKACIARGVPEEVFTAPYTVKPYRALGFGSPSNRLAALDELMQYYGSLDPVGQNNLLRDRFAQRVTYGQVDRYVPRLELGGRLPVDKEIAELQNIAMNNGAILTVAGNDNHILHLQVHFPDIDQDLLMMESGQGSPQILQAIRVKAEHIQQHMGLLKPDKLNEKIVKELGRVFNNTIERVQAAFKAAETEAAKQQESPQPTRKQQEMMADAAVGRQIKIEDAALDRELRAQQAAQERAIEDARGAARTTAEANAQRLLGSAA